MLRAVIIDDERHGREMLKMLLEKYFSASIHIVGLCPSAAAGVQTVREVKPDVVFLDIEMPEASGFDFIKAAGPFIDFELVFVTAYQDYAVQAFRVHALDYLLKPVKPEDLKDTINLLEKRLQKGRPKHEVDRLLQVLEVATMVVGIPTNEGVVFLNVNNIMRCEASSNYTVIYLEKGKKMIASRTLKDIEVALPSEIFVRTHRTHLINLRKLRQYFKNSNYIELEDGSKVPVSRSAKEDFEKRIFVIK